MLKIYIVLVGTLLLCLSASAITIDKNSSTQNINNLSSEKSDYLVYKKAQYVAQDNIFSADIKDFYRMALLRSILDTCDTNILLNQKWQEFIVDYSKYIIAKNAISDEQVIELISNAQINVQEKYNKNIPLTICEQAYRKSESLTYQWKQHKK